jgi:hypothetical protein
VTAPANQTVGGTAPGQALVVNYPAPSAADNCPGVTTLCTPASGSPFPSGTTSVSCTATDASGNTATASFGVRNFDACVQDDVGGEFVRWSTADGVYEFRDCGDSACGATAAERSGTGVATPTASGFLVQDAQDDRSVRASVGLGSGKGRARIKFSSGSTKLSAKLKDAVFADDACACP